MSAPPLDPMTTDYERALTIIDRLQTTNAELLDALKLYVAHYGDPLKVARQAIANAEATS